MKPETMGALENLLERLRVEQADAHARLMANAPPPEVQTVETIVAHLESVDGLMENVHCFIADCARREAGRRKGHAR